MSVIITWRPTPIRIADADADMGQLVRVNPTGGAIVITLPDLTSNAAMDGTSACVKNVSASTNNITVQVENALDIDGAATYVINTARGSAVFVWDHDASEFIIQAVKT